MPWFKVDDKLHEHDKPRKAGKAAMGVWALAGSWCADNLRDGFVPERVLSRWGTRRDAQALVDSGLWHSAEVAGERGWLFHDWHDFQPTKEEVEKERAATRKRMQRWREKQRDAVSDGVTNGVSDGVSHAAPSRPDPSRPLTVVATSSQSSSAPAELDDDGLTRIRQALNNCPESHARKCSAFILAKAPTDVRNPTAYVLAAIRDEPDAYRYRRGNPKRDQECPEHAGQWADACAGCAADRKATA